MRDDKPPTFFKTLRVPEFWLLIVTAAAGSAGGPWWVFVPLCVAGLSISALPKYLKLWPRAQRVGAEWKWLETAGLSTFNSVGAACGAFMLGVMARWMWF